MPRHAEAANFLRLKLFDNLNDFAELEARITALPSEKRGDAFEVFAEAYFATQKTAQAKEVWPDKSIPLKLKKQLALPVKEMGVDARVGAQPHEQRASGKVPRVQRLNECIAVASATPPAAHSLRVCPGRRLCVGK